MQKQIKFTGMNLATPQNESPDGACQEIINLRHRYGAWRPVGPKTSIGSSAFPYLGSPIEFDAIYLHDIEGGFTPGEPNWIGYYSGAVYSIDPNTSLVQLIADSLLTDPDFVPVVSFLKRFMMVTSDTGVKLFLWKDGSYNKVEALPVPEVDLLKQNLFLVNYPLFDQKFLAADVLSQYYKILNDQSSNEGRLYGSVMYMAAYKLFDGSFVMPTIPKYLDISNDGIVVLTNALTGDNDGYSTFFQFQMAGIQAVINNELFPSATYDTIKDLVESVCIFATRVQPIHKIDESTFTDLKLKTPPYNYPPNGTTKGDSMAYFSNYFIANPEFAKLAKSDGWYKIHEFVFESLVGKTGNTFADVDTKNYYQDYATRQTLPTDQFTHHTLVPKVSFVYNDRIHEGNIKTLYGKPYVQWPRWTTTYNTGSSTINGTVTVWLKTSLGNAIQVSPIEVPYFRGAAWNNESFTDIPGGLSAADQAKNRVAYLNANPLTGMAPGSVFYQVWDRPATFSGVNPFVTYPYTAPSNVHTAQVIYRTTNLSVDTILLPSVVGYNDSRAYRMMITFNSGHVLIDTPLKKNEGMNFAYWHNEAMSPNDTTQMANYPVKATAVSSFTAIASTPDPVQTSYDTNRIQVSEIQNPLIYPAKNSYQIGTGDIIALAAGSEPLSLGQFGQFPLQVFTTKGIWALELGTGAVLYTNVLPVNGEVADNAKNIISMMGGVVYSTVRGLNIIHGAKVTHLSEAVEGEPPDGLRGLESVTTLVVDARFTPGLEDSFSPVGFLDYLANSIIGFDQTNKELIVTNPTYAYSYILSFESKVWTKVSVSYKLLINAWPKLLGLTATDIMDLSTEGIGYVEAMIMTCAQSFEMPEVLKKVERMVARCYLSSLEYVGLYLFGSDDLNTWQLLTGRQRTEVMLKDLMIQRSHGASKYYAIIINGKITTDSYIDHIDFSFIPKWAGKLR